MIGKHDCPDCQKLLLIVADLRKSRLGVKALPSNIRKTAVAMVKAGKTQRAVAEHFNLNRGTISRWCKLAKVSTDFNKFRSRESSSKLKGVFFFHIGRGKSMIEAAKATDINLITARRWLKEKGIETEGQKLAKLRRKNPTTSERHSTLQVSTLSARTKDKAFDPICVEGDSAGQGVATGDSAQEPSYSGR